MKSKAVQEVRDLLGSEEFRAWDRRHIHLKDELISTQGFIAAREEEIRLATFKSEIGARQAEDILFRCGELEGRSESAGAEYAEIDNDSFELLSTFEEQRQVVRAKRIDRDRADELIEKLRPETSELRAKMKAETINSAEINRLKELSKEITGLEGEANEIWMDLEMEETKKEDLWGNIEGTWSKALRASMARAVYGFESRRLRSRTEKAYTAVELTKDTVGDLNKELDTARERLTQGERDLADHRGQATTDFECIIVEDFLFWPREDDVQSAICVPLIEDRDHLNLQIKKMEIYEVSRHEGIDFVVPLPVGDTSSKEDPRLEKFFAPCGA